MYSPIKDITSSFQIDPVLLTHGGGGRAGLLFVDLTFFE